jgi:hypothetical protein
MQKLLLQALPIASAILICHAIDSYKASAETNTEEAIAKQTIANINYNYAAKLLLPAISTR